MMMHLNRRGAAALFATGLLAAVATGCSPTASQNAGGASTQSSNIKVVVVSGPLSDPFFGAMKSGAEQAGKDLGVNVQYTAPQDLKNLAADLSRLQDAAVAGKPSAVVASEFLPDAQDPGLKKMVESGIPVVFMNAGPNWESLGGVTYIGEDPSVVGQQAGKELSGKGAKKVLCVNHVPGNPTLDARCQGMDQAVRAAGGTTQVLNIPADQSTNPTAVSNAISGALRADASIDGVFTLGSSVAENAVNAVAAAGVKATVGTTDLSKNVLDMVQSGKLSFTVDQQPYLQGYYSVLAAVQKVKLGLQPIGKVGTSPLMITQDNVAETIKFNDQNNGLRGAS